MKALLDKKNNEKLQLEEQKVKEDRKKKKVRDKVLASINEVVQTDPVTEIAVPIKRGNNSVSGRNVRSSSVSVQLYDPKKNIKGAGIESTTVSSIVPSSKEDKKRLMKETYGFTDDNLPRRKLNRESSRGSVRSSHSV
jgi:hypothetical protein